LHSATRAPLDDPEADPVSKFRGGDLSNIWKSSLITDSPTVCKRDEVYFTTLLWRNNGRKNGFMVFMVLLLIGWVMKQ